MVEDYIERRQCFLLQALDDVKKWCVAPNKLVGKRHSDLYWLQVFGLSDTEIATDSVKEFFALYRLARQGDWSYQAIAELITARDGLDNVDGKLAIDKLAERLTGYVTRKSTEKRQQTSAASKIGFFLRPKEDIYIWDQYATRSAKFRDWRRKGGSGVPPRSSGVYKADHREHDYTAFRTLCTEALREEREKADFMGAIAKIRDFLRRVGGPTMNADLLKSSFVERRYLDKLMFWEGRWIEDWRE